MSCDFVPFVIPVEGSHFQVACCLCVFAGGSAVSSVNPSTAIAPKYGVNRAFPYLQ